LTEPTHAPLNQRRRLAQHHKTKLPRNVFVEASKKQQAPVESKLPATAHARPKQQRRLQCALPRAAMRFDAPKWLSQTLFWRRAEKAELQ
jgi:hypothetical protein